MTVSAYADKAVQAVLDEFARVASPGNISDPLFRAAARCYEFVNAGAADEAYVEAELYRIATQAGHSPAETRTTLRSARKHTAGKAATIPASTNGAHASAGQGYADLGAYAAAQGSDRATFAAAGWSDAQLYEYTYTDKSGKLALGLTPDEPLPYTRIRRALKLTTDAGPRWRLIDEDKPTPKYWHPAKSHQDSNKAWYKIGEALALAAQAGYLALCNGEASVVCAQARGVPALCETGGGEKATPPQLLQMLRALWQGPILIALDGDKRGREAGLKKLAQYRAAGYGDVRALELGDGLDLATFCKLHQTQAAQALPACPDLPDPSQASQGPGGPLTQSQAIVRTLAGMGYAFRLNLCGNVIEVNGEPITDWKGAEIRTKLRDIGQKLAPVEDAYIARAVEDAYHPVKDYLLGLAWDGQERIAQLAACLRGDNPVVAYQDGQACPLESVYLHRWLIGAVAKALAQAQNGVLVFTGAQGKGKSQLSRWLCPDELQARYFLEAAIDPRDKDANLRLMSKFVWEVGEIDATTRKADVSALKDFVSQKFVTVRRSYGRYDTTGPALASLIGTVNTSDFLADDTGNRRFYVIDIQDLDWAYGQIDKDQIWAEAVARYRRGEPWQLLPAEQAVQEGHNRQYLADGIMGDWLRRYFIVTPHEPANTLTAADVIDVLRRKELPVSTNDRALSMDISRAMAALGVTKTRTKDGRFYIGIMTKP
jgi:hypothetical protein